MELFLDGVDSLKFSFSVPKLFPRMFTKGKFSQVDDTGRFAKTVVPPSTSLLKVLSTGGKRKREESRERPITFECLEVERAPKSDAQEPELISEDESSFEDEQDTKMLNLPSSSGKTMSTSTTTADEDGADSGRMMPIFKSYNLDFISPEEQRHGRQQSMQEGLSPVRQLESMDIEDLVEGGSMQKEVTSPPIVAVPGSQCLLGRKKDSSLSIGPTGLMFLCYCIILLKFLLMKFL